MIWEKISRGLKSFLDFDDGGLLDFDVDDVRLRSRRLTPCLLGPLLALLDPGPVTPDVGAGLKSRRRPAIAVCFSTHKRVACTYEYELQEGPIEVCRTFRSGESTKYNILYRARRMYSTSLL
jgi:hypothetical protein